MTPRPSRLGDSAIKFADLQSALTLADPSALIVSARTLRKVIERDRGLRFLGGHARRQPYYVISHDRFDALVEDLEIVAPRGAAAECPWLLVAAPEPDDVASAKPETLLLEIWRRLYRAKIEAEVAKRVGRNDVKERRARIGATEFEEIRNVLKADAFLFDPEDDLAVYIGFAGLYAELTMFATTLIHHTFPGIEDPREVENVVALDVNFQGLFLATRPAGASNPPGLSSSPLNGSHDHGSREFEAETPLAPEPADMSEPIRGSARLRLLEHAQKALQRGNAVRAAILRDASARQADPGSSTIKADLRAAASALEQLASRLQAALFFRKGEIRRWTEALAPLLRRASRGFWTPEARLLYDLQKVCIDHERETYRIDLIGWLFTGGRRPLKRPLPHLREVTMSKHLRSASGRLNQVKLSRDDRNKLETLLRPAVRQAEAALRERFRPTIDSTLKAHWVAPKNLPERVAYQKLVEELLDRIVERGFLSLSDLRDAASRSHLKLPDLGRPADFFQGNQLLKTDKALSVALEGVHRRGEIYLRWLQRFSSLAFATPEGRLFSLYIALPFGGSYVVLEGLQHIVGALVHYFTGYHPELMNRWSFLAVGSLALGAINFLRFRRDFLGLVRMGLRSVRALCYDWPAWILSNPLLRRVLQSRFTSDLWKLALKPMICTIPVVIVAAKIGMDSRSATIIWTLSALLISLLINTRQGRKIEEALLEAMSRAWLSLVQDLLPGLFHLIMNSFQRFLERLERIIYAVDEWLRFRDGQTQASLVLKGMIGLVWFGIAYLARIYVNLLIEPQINPIKHFPVVTVSHKIILPMTVPLTRIVSAPIKPFIGTVAGNAVAGMTVVLLPGVFGFLVWEFKANWRLYEANRSKTLDPVLVGSHGESMVRLLRPGFHSGTLPKAYASLRRGEWKAKQGGREKAALKPLTTLHHVEESVRHFLNRDFLGLFKECGESFGIAIRVGSIHTSTNRIRVELVPGEQDRKSLWLNLEEYDGRLNAGISEPGWFKCLSPCQRIIMEDALVGLYKMSGVQMSWIPREPRPATGGTEFRVNLDEVDVTWKRWVEAWEVDQVPTEEADSSGSHFGRVVVLGPAAELDHDDQPAEKRINLHV